MRMTCKRLLLIGFFLALLGLGTVASQAPGYWETVLAENFDQLRIPIETFKGLTGTFGIEDNTNIISQEFDGENGYLLYDDPTGGLPEGSALYGIPEHPFDNEDVFFFEFVVKPDQEGSRWEAGVSDEDDLDVLLISMNPNGQWFVNGQDTEVPYSAGVTYVVRVEIARDPESGEAGYIIHCHVQGDESTVTLLSAGILNGFDGSSSIEEVRFEKPAQSPAGSFILDDVLIQYLTYPSGHDPHIAEGQKKTF